MLCYTRVIVQAMTGHSIDNSALEAEARYRRAKLISNIGFVVGGLFLFFSLWYIIAQGTAFDLGDIVGNMLGMSSSNGKNSDQYDVCLELEPIDPKKIPVIFLDEAPPRPTPVPTTKPTLSPQEEKERQLKQALEAANHRFRSWRFFEAEKAYIAIVKSLPRDRAQKLQRKLTKTFFKKGLKFFKEKRYSKALEVLRISLHFDANNVKAHRYVARCYRLLGQGSKASYHEKRVKTLERQGRH